MEKVFFEHIEGITYQAAWDYQRKLMKGLIENKLQNRDRIKSGEAAVPQQHSFLFCEHSPVYTLGKSGSADHLLLQQKGLEEKGIEFFKINRGGDITYHGPGQIVGYPILDMDCFFNDVHKYVRYLEEAIIMTLKEYGLETVRMEGFTGVWLPETNQLPKRKICAIGVHFSRWVTMHGFALNVNTDLSYFNFIVPCGINDSDKTVTSMAVELGRAIDEQEVRAKIATHFSELFNFEIVNIKPKNKAADKAL